MFEHVFVAFPLFTAATLSRPPRPRTHTNTRTQKNFRGAFESPAVQVDYVKNASFLRPVFVPAATNI